MLVENKVKDSIDGLKQVAVRVFVEDWRVCGTDE
jgi:hypothetical protein